LTSSRVTLESFEGDAATDIAQSADYKRGLTDGLAQAETSQNADLYRSIGEISSTLADMTFGYEEARRHVFERLHPLLGQITEAILPLIALETFGAHLTDVIEAEFQTAAGAPIMIAVACDLVQALNRSATGDQFTFVGDPTLSAGQALIRQDDTHILLDLPALTLALQSALNGLERPERTQSHG
jgi:hypothetical protein